MRLEPALVDPTFELCVTRMVEHVDEVELLVPALLELLTGQLEAEAVDLSDLTLVVRRVELIDRGTLAGEVRPPGPEHVVEVAGDPRQRALRVAVDHAEGMHGRAVVVEV